MFLPPFSSDDSCLADLQERGYTVLQPASVEALSGVSVADLAALRSDWQQLERDGYLKDGGSYRRRRHASFLLDEAGLRGVPHRPHWQPLSYNALHGGMERWFAPVSAQTTASGPKSPME